MPNNDQDLTAYQLTSSVLNSLNIDNGVLTKFHNQFKNTSDYLNDLKLLQYDMLYGEHYIYGGTNPFIATDLKMGTYDISITDVYEETTTTEEVEDLETIASSEDPETIEEIDELEGKKNLVVKGENFNEFSKIYINGKYTKTVFIDSNTLMVNNITLEPNSSIVVTQRTTGGGKLGSTNEFIYPIVAEQ